MGTQLVPTEAHVNVVAQGDKQACSVSEVEVDGLTRDTSLRCDISDSNARPPLLKQNPCSVENAPAGLRISERLAGP